MRHEFLKRGKISITSFTLLDEEMLLEILGWRNHNDIRLMMNEMKPIRPADHLRFCSNLVENTQARYWLARRKEKPCGVVYLHSLENDFIKSEWGFYLSPNYLGSGVGLEIAYEAIQLFFEKIGVRKLFGYVKETNLENLRLQKLIGFKSGALLVKNDVRLVETTLTQKLPEEEFKNFQKRVIYGR